MSDQPQNQAQTPRVKTGLEEPKLRLLGEILKGARRPSTWQVTMFGNQLRVTCYTNIENDKNNGRIEAKMDSITAYSFFELLRDVLAHKGPIKRFIECKTVVNGDWKNPVLESTLVVGRGEDNVVFVGIVSADNDRPRLQFRLRPTDFHALLGEDRKPMPEDYVSEVYGRGYLNLITQLAANVLDTHFREAQRPQGGQGGQGGWKGGNKGGGNWNKGGSGGGNWNKGGNGGGGNWNKGGQGGGGNWSKPSEPEPTFEADEDIPF